jgi:hypothetical protein
MQQPSPAPLNLVKCKLAPSQSFTISFLAKSLTCLTNNLGSQTQIPVPHHIFSKQLIGIRLRKVDKNIQSPFIDMIEEDVEQFIEEMVLNPYFWIVFFIGSILTYFALSAKLNISKAGELDLLYYLLLPYVRILKAILVVIVGFICGFIVHLFTRNRSYL